MKKCLYFIVFIVLTSFVSCSEEETVYSCDEQTNEWVKTNLSVIRNMSRQQWKTLSQIKKIPAYRAFSQVQKLNFWKDKLAETLKLDWTNEEKKHILQLYNFITENPDIFRDGGMSDEMQDKYDLFFYEWTEFAKEKLGWKMNTMVSIAGSGDEMTNKSGIVNKKNKSKINGFGDFGVVGRFSCNCNLTYDFCSFPMGGGSTCVDVACDATSIGCGWIFASSCNGSCDDFF